MNNDDSGRAVDEMTSTETDPVTVESAAARPIRKDALRNRALLLEAARTVFAERGLEASLDDIAHAAGLGVGTAYRHFANKQEVVAALFDQAIDDMIANVEAALLVEDPWAALAGFFETAATSQAKDRGLHEVLMGSVPHDHDVLRRRFAPPMQLLFDRARAAGVIRPELGVNDAAVVFAMLGAAYEMHGPSSPESWRRYLALLLDGMRATDRDPLPVPPLSDDDIDAAMAAIKFRR
jgi:AcrR family transcriptional regulator